MVRNDFETPTPARMAQPKTARFLWKIFPQKKRPQFSKTTLHKALDAYDEYCHKKSDLNFQKTTLYKKVVRNRYCWSAYRLWFILFLLFWVDGCLYSIAGLNDFSCYKTLLLVEFGGNELDPYRHSVDKSCWHRQPR